MCRRPVPMGVPKPHWSPAKWPSLSTAFLTCFQSGHLSFLTATSSPQSQPLSLCWRVTPAPSNHSLLCNSLSYWLSSSCTKGKKSKCINEATQHRHEWLFGNTSRFPKLTLFTTLYNINKHFILYNSQR